MNLTIISRWLYRFFSAKHGIPMLCTSWWVNIHWKKETKKKQQKNRENNNSYKQKKTKKIQQTKQKKTTSTKKKKKKQQQKFYKQFLSSFRTMTQVNQNYGENLKSMDQYVR